MPTNESNFPDGSVSHWIEQAKAGDEQAAEQLWARYFQRLMSFARKRMDGMKRRSQDEEDIAIAALTTLLQGAKEGRFPGLQDRDGLWPLLAKITERKVINLWKQERTQKRGGGRVRGESVFGSPRPDEPGLGIEGVAEPVPEDAFSQLLCSECNHLMHQLDDDSLRLIARRRLEGFSNVEIAKEVGCVTRTIDRKLERIRAIWAKDSSITLD